MATKKTEKSTPQVPTRITGPRQLQSVTGTKDRVGIERRWWHYFYKIAFETAEKYNFNLVNPSSIEYTTNYTRSLGKDHPLVEDNLLTIFDPNQEHISLRPSLDISYLRTYYLQHKNKFDEKILPIEHWYTLGTVFGNKFEPREQLQLFLGVLGNNHPVVDAECTIAAYRFLQSLGFSDMQVMVNSIGGKQSQTAYKAELSNYYKDRKKEVPKELQSLITKDPIAIYKDNSPEAEMLRQEAPQSVDWLIDDDKDHFVRVLEYLDELDIPYMLAPDLVSDEEYHQKTLIAIKLQTEDTSYILAKGTRFDGLSDSFTDVEIAGMKMTVNFDRCLSAIRHLGINLPEERLPQVYFAQLGDAAKKKALAVREELHKAGIITYEHFGQDSLRKQLEEAVELKVKYTVILGQKELLDGTVLVRDMDGGIQEEVSVDKLANDLKKRLT